MELEHDRQTTVCNRYKVKLYPKDLLELVRGAGFAPPERGAAIWVESSGEYIDVVLDCPVVVAWEASVQTSLRGPLPGRRELHAGGAGAEPEERS